MEWNFYVNRGEAQVTRPQMHQVCGVVELIVARSGSSYNGHSPLCSFTSQ